MKRVVIAAAAAAVLLTGCGGGEKTTEELQESARMEVLAHCRTEVEKQLGGQASWSQEQIEWAEVDGNWNATVTGFADVGTARNFFECIAKVDLAEGEVLSKVAMVEPR